MNLWGHFQEGCRNPENLGLGEVSSARMGEFKFPRQGWEFEADLRFHRQA